MKERTKANPPTSNDGIYFNNEVAEKEGGFFRKGTYFSFLYYNCKVQIDCQAQYEFRPQ